MVVERWPGCPGASDQPPSALLRREQSLHHAAILLGTLPSEQAVHEDVLGLQVRRRLDAPCQ